MSQSRIYPHNYTEGERLHKIHVQQAKHAGFKHSGSKTVNELNQAIKTPTTKGVGGGLLSRLFRGKRRR